MPHSTTPLLLSLCSALVLAGTARAADINVYRAEKPPSLMVKVHEGDLTTTHGAKALARRIRDAAAEVCGANVDWSPPSARAECREAAIDRVIKEMNSPLLADALGRAPPVLARNGR